MKFTSLVIPSFLCSSIFILSCTRNNSNSDAIATPATFKSSSDLANNSDSNVTIKNLGATKNATGLYVPQLGYTTGADCTSSTVLYTSTSAGGAMFSTVPLPKDQSVAIGKNYLYNMLLTAIYYNNQQALTPSPCTLPGCQWSVTDTTPYKWCVYVGLLYPQMPVPGTSVLPYAEAVSGAGYNYDGVTVYNTIGPITCDDTTLECSAASAQEQTLL